MSSTGLRKPVRQPVPPEEATPLPADRVGYRVKSALLGRPLHTRELEHERLGKPTALAVFASDNLSSSAYATEEILRVLVPAVGLAAFSLVTPITLAMLVVLGFLILSYRQTIKAYPTAGGAYMVTRDNFASCPRRSLESPCSRITCSRSRSRWRRARPLWRRRSRRWPHTSCRCPLHSWRSSPTATCAVYANPDGCSPRPLILHSQHGRAARLRPLPVPDRFPTRGTTGRRGHARLRCVRPRPVDGRGAVRRVARLRVRRRGGDRRRSDLQ